MLLISECIHAIVIDFRSNLRVFINGVFLKLEEESIETTGGQFLFVSCLSKLLVCTCCLKKSIVDGPHKPVTTTVDVQRPKTVAEYEEKDIALITHDNKAYGSIAMALPMDVFNIFAEYTTAKDLWVALCTSVHGEPMSELINILSSIVSKLKVLGTEYPTVELNKKLLDSLHEEWNMYRIMIKKTEKLSELSQQELFSILEAYELEIKKKTDVPPSVSGIQPTTSTTPQKPTTMIHDEYLPIMTTFMSCYHALISRNLTPLGHFSRNCKEPSSKEQHEKKNSSGKQAAVSPKSNTSSSSTALVCQADGHYHWRDQEGEAADKALMADIE
ncbi:hypothetical protein L1987_33194 [Smallanthus sonchifolius]|uniref:Uncharacterized protein n=1 Tax=Smallanthus sonchifolius TaxID=185202 RepID=A0ACB9HQE1_9ASTR|nr:hypothetical protein L1987_33194 [Smallanthus sonchifolius]